MDQFGIHTMKVKNKEFFCKQSNKLMAIKAGFNLNFIDTIISIETI